MINVWGENVFEIRNDVVLDAFSDWVRANGELPRPDGQWRDMVAFQAGWSARHAEVLLLQDQIRRLEAQIYGGSTK
jgi:hypothetical protein